MFRMTFTDWFNITRYETPHTWFNRHTLDTFDYIWLVHGQGVSHIDAIYRTFWCDD